MQGLGDQGVDEPVAADVPRGHDVLSTGGAGDRAGAGVVLAGLGTGVAVRVVPELCKYPGAEHRSQSGLGADDLSVGVPAEAVLDLPVKEVDLLVQGDQQRD
ncbi:hypothetical protein GCM10010430_50930 [Kitasatospora cystarginea]|uniref:Uncharacterized protein n=1 Tax=Kitasatospora cystarginea TaxID=58350 RepID=A0ABN3EJI3_9ACTN